MKDPRSTRARRWAFAVIFVVAGLIAVAGVVGFLAAGKLPTPGEVGASTSIQQASDYGRRIESLEDYISLAYCIVVAGLAVLVAAVFLFAGRDPRWRAARERIFDFDRVRASMKTVAVFAVGITVALSMILIARSNRLNLRPGGDEISYLETALHARDAYGVAGFAKALYTGQWPETHTHPLYVWIIMPLASPSLVFYVLARMASGILAVGTVLVVLVTTWRLFGPAVAALVLLLYAVNRIFLDMSGQIVPQMLLVSLVTLSFYFTVRGLSHARQVIQEGAQPCAPTGARGLTRERQLIPAGFLGGLAYMTSVEGLLLAVAFAAAALSVWRGAALRRKYFYLYFVAFLVASSPLLVRNTVRFGNPFKEYAFSVMWLDQRQDTQSMDFIEGRTGPLFYVRHHTVLEAGLTLLEGGEMTIKNAASTVSPLVKSIYLPAGSFRGRFVQLWAGAGLLAIAFLAVLLDTDVGRRAFVIWLGLVALLPMAWYARIAVQPSSVLPFAPVVFCYASIGIMQLLRARLYKTSVLLVACALATWSAGDRLGVVRPFRVQAPDRGAVALSQWLDSRVNVGDVVLVGPDDSLRVNWFEATRGIRKAVPATRDIEGLVAASRKLKARYVVISRNLYDMRLLQFATSFKTVNLDLVPSHPIDGWKQVFEDPTPPVDYVVFEVLAPGPNLKDTTANGK